MELTIFDVIYSLLSDVAEDIYTLVRSGDAFLQLVNSARSILTQFDGFPAWCVGFLSFSFSAALLLKLWGRS